MGPDKKINEELFSLFKTYIDTLENQCPQLRTDSYSYVYCTTAPNGWSSSDNRYLIVGEEGFGVKPRFSSSEEEVTESQTFNSTYLSQQLYGLKDNKSPFWRRFRRISELGKCSWTNFDKIHNQKKDLKRNNCPLSDRDRKLLHGLPQLLKEEIRILKPTTVVFFGWHWKSLEHELPEIYEKLRSLDHSVKDAPILLCHNKVNYLIAYHPYFRPQKYEDEVISLLESCKERK